MADDNSVEALKARYEALIADVDAKIKALEQKKKQLTEALDWNQGYYEKSMAIQKEYDALVQLVKTSGINTVLEDAKSKASKIAEELVAVAANAKKALEGKTEIEKMLASVQEYQKTGNQLLASINQIKTQVDQNHANVGKVSSFADEASKILQSVKTSQEEWIAKSKKALEDFSGKEVAQWKKFEKEVTENTEKAKKLLGYATDASLAHAFHTKKSEMFKTSLAWNIIFVLAVIGMLILALTKSEEFKDIGYLYGLLLKLPYLAPLVWLAYFAQGRSGLYSRLADDYGHKEAVSIAFEGYKVKVSDIEVAKAETERPDEVLVRQTLKAIGNDPERIHAVYKAPPTPFETFATEGLKAVQMPNAQPNVIGRYQKWIIGLGITVGATIAVVIWIVVKLLPLISAVSKPG